MGSELLLPSWEIVFFVVGVWAGFIFLVAKFAKESDFEAKLSLYIQGDYQNTWPELYRAFFETLFGRRTFSFNGFFRSSIASILCVLFILYLYNVSGLLERVENLPSLREVILLSLTINLLADYLSLTETRVVLRYAEKYTNPGIQLCILIVDLIFTGVVIYVAINCYRILTGEGLMGPGQLVGILSTYSIFFYSTFLTSFWAWLYFTSSWLMPIFKIEFFNQASNYIKHPFLAFTLVTSLLLGATAFTVQLVPVERFDQSICEIFGGEVCVKVEGLTTDDVQKLVYIERVCRDSRDVLCPLEEIKRRGYDATKVGTIIQTACENKKAFACYLEGNTFDFIDGPDESAKKARRLFERACDGGYSTACADLGVMYAYGLGGSEDGLVARRLLETSCNRQVLSGCHNLGEMHSLGIGGAKNFIKAKRLYDWSCKRDYMLACYKHGTLFAAGYGEKQNLVEARRLYKLACEGGELRGCSTLANMLRAGYGGNQDDFEARRLYDLACTGGNMLGCFGLGNMYKSGVGGEKNEIEARRLLRVACDGGWNDACGNLAFMHDLGIGGPRDKKEVFRLMKKYCEGGGRTERCYRYR